MSEKTPVLYILRSDNKTVLLQILALANCVLARFKQNTLFLTDCTEYFQSTEAIEI